MSVRAIPVPEIDEEGGLSAIASWLDDWNVYLGRSKHYHAYGVPPADIPETFPAVARVGDADLAATIARFADETGCANETRLRQANITLYCDRREPYTLHRTWFAPSVPSASVEV